MSRIRRRWVLLAAVLGVVLVSAALIVASPGVLVRLRVLTLASSGRIDGLGARDAKRIFGRDANAWMRDILGTHNAYASIPNPHPSASDAVVGADTFQQNCAACHGAGAKGSHVAPALIGRSLATGNSDWSVFRTIQNGVPGTSMPPHPWSDEQIWQTVAYLRSAGLSDGHGGGTTAAVDPRLESFTVSYDELAHAGDPAADWPMYSGSYSGSRHSKLAQITPANVGRLVPRWLYQFSGVTGKLETTPLVRNGIMFVSTPTSVLALDAQTGLQLWKFVRALPEGTLPCCGLVNRGVALMGSSLFFGTADAHLLAISARSGRVLWDTRVAEDYHDGYSITSAPLAFGDLVVVGIGGGDYATRGYLAAFDAQTGKQRWKFFTIPGAGEPGNDTWLGDSWKSGGGAPWMTGSYDPETDTLYFGTGNAAPDYSSITRKGDNLYTDSVIALRGSTGQKLWHFQFTPGDTHDWDSSQVPVLVDRPGEPVAHQLIWANRNGFFYAFDRESGRLLTHRAFVKQTWAKDLDGTGRPIVLPNTDPTPDGVILFPSGAGAANWWPSTYAPEPGLLLVPALEQGGLYYSGNHAKPRKGKLFEDGAGEERHDRDSFANIVAINPRDASIVWRHRLALKADYSFSTGGLMSTSGGLVFGSLDQTFYALDISNGNMAWQFPAGGAINAAPISYQVGTEQFVAVAASGTVIAFSLLDPQTPPAPAPAPDKATKSGARRGT